MCLAVPGQVVGKEGDASGLPMGTVSFGGVRKEVCLAYCPEVEIGDWVLVHVGFALARIDEDEAREVFRALERMDELAEPGPPPTGPGGTG